MNEVVKFRGLNNSGEFEYGNLIKYRGHLEGFVTAIQTLNEDETVNSVVPVKPESVGQFTGLLDKHGKEAYISDIVNAKIRDSNGVTYNVVGTIAWGDFELTLEMESDAWPVASWHLVDSFEVIGNIYEKHRDAVVSI